jgi:hypothetical protein
MRKEMTGVGERSRERKLTWMMFCVVILFILSNTHFLSHILLGTNCISEKTFFILRPIYSLLYVINSSVNLFIYIYYNDKFRGHFIAIFSCTKTNYRGVSTRAIGTTTVAPKFSDTLTLFQPRGAYSAYHHRGYTQNFPEDTSLNQNASNVSRLWFVSPMIQNTAEHIIDTYITETDTTEIGKPRHSIIDIFIIET